MRDGALVEKLRANDSLYSVNQPLPFFARAVIDATRADHFVFCIPDFDQIYNEAIKPAI